MNYIKPSVIRKKGESQNGCFKKTKHAKFSEKRTFLTPWYAHVHPKCLFFGKFGVFFFSWNTRFEIRPLALLPTKLCLTYWNLSQHWKWKTSPWLTKMMENDIIVCTSSFSAGGLNLLPNFQKGERGLTGSQFLETGCWEGEGGFFQEGL